MTLHLDIFSGLSGDMFLGALLDLGVPFATLESELRKLGVHGYHLHQHRASKSGIDGVKFDVHLEHDHDHDRKDTHTTARTLRVRPGTMTTPMATHTTTVMDTSTATPMRIPRTAITTITTTTTPGTITPTPATTKATHPTPAGSMSTDEPTPTSGC